VARDRKRAKQRRERRGTGAGGRSGPPAERPREAARSAPAPPADVTVEPDVPGALDHASGEADEFRAALARGADGVPASEAPVEDELQEREPELADSEPEADEPSIATPVDAEERADGAEARAAARAERASGAPLPSGNRALAFLRASWAELQRVQWPDRRQVTQATAVVLGFVAVAGAYLGLADVVAKEIVEFVL
jgi:preprotein translocase subunit SecE